MDIDYVLFDNELRELVTFIFVLLTFKSCFVRDQLLRQFGMTGDYPSLNYDGLGLTASCGRCEYAANSQ